VSGEYKVVAEAVTSRWQLMEQPVGGWVIMNRVGYAPSSWTRFWIWVLLGWKWKQFK
jgi:hypothetical protein